MSLVEQQYIVPAGFDPASISPGRGVRVSARPGSWTSATRSYLDSFDWRLYDAGGVIVEEARRGHRSLKWLSLESGRLLASFANRAAPSFASELPPGPAQQRLSQILEMRALLPMVRLKIRSRTCSFVDDQEKIVAQLVQEKWHLEPAEGESAGRHETRLHLLPIKGYGKVSRALKRAIESCEGVVPAADDIYLAALSRTKRTPGDFTSKLRVQLEPTMRSDSALRLILDRLLETFEATREGTIEDLDSEFLHDLRVAVRRARSALGQIKGVLPKTQSDQLRAELAWMGQVTGPERDLDVYLLNFADYRHSLPPSRAEDIDPLRDFLLHQKRQVHEPLVRALRGSRYKRLTKAWRKLATNSIRGEPDHAPHATETIADLSAQRIYKSYRRVMRDGSKIGPKTEAEALHELRIDCKKLRYLMEFFRSLYPPNEIQALIKSLKSLQDNLGDFQDFEIQMAHLRDYGKEMAEKGFNKPGTAHALDLLVRGLAVRQHEARQEFAVRFGAFSSKANRKRFKQLFGGAAPQGGAQP